MPYVLYGIILIALIILVRNIRIVPQAHAFVIERLGAYSTTWHTGLHFKIPFIEVVSKKISLKEQVLDFPPQPVITKDNVTMQIDTVVYYQITDPRLYTYGVERFMMAMETLTATTLRNIIGDLELDQTLTSRDVINTKMRAILDEATDPWGIKVNRVELKNILPPQDIQNSMEKQMKAERERRAVITEAEGEKQAAIARAEGAKQAAILESEGRKEAAFRDAEARERAAEAEAKATAMVSEAIARGDVNAINYFVAQKYVEAFAELARNPTAKTVIVPAEMSGLVGTIAGIGELVGLARDQQQNPPRPPAPPRASRASVPPTT